jgi:choice-of-anchor C domain-containing protein
VDGYPTASASVPGTSIRGRNRTLVLHHCRRQGGFPVKRRSALGVALGFVATIAFAGSTQAAFAGPTNGSFETGTYVDNGSGFRQQNAGELNIDDWTVGGHSVDWIETYWPAQEGTRSIDLSGSNAGSLSETFETTIGNTYDVSFALSGNPAGPPTVKTLQVSATGGTTGLYMYDLTVNANDLTDMKWSTQTYSFVATSATTTLTFTSTTAGAFGPALDDVVVTADALEKDDCKQGGWESIVDTAGNSFKNQGDCVSFFATQGKNLGAIPPTVTSEAAAFGSDSTSVLKGSAKHVEKAASKTERHTAKVKTNSHTEKAKTKSPSGKSQGKGSKKPK